MWNIINWWNMRRKGNWAQNTFNPKNPDKCLNMKMNNAKLPFYRSSWEAKMFNWCDENKNVVRWGSEILAIPYIYDIEKVKGIHKTHKYYPDLYCEIRNKQGLIEKFVIEIKPVKQKNKPIKPKRRTKKALKNYTYAVHEYVKNQNKWKYARSFCEGKNWKFRIVTEENIFNGEV
jgi:hypothetical protein